MADDRSFMLMSSNDFGTVDSKNDLPQGQDTYNSIKSAYIVRQGRRVFRRINNLFNEVNVLSLASVNDLPSDRIVYKTTYDSYSDTLKYNVFIYIWNQYINSRVYSSYSSYSTMLQTQWPQQGEQGQSTTIYYDYDASVEEDDRYYLWRNGQMVKATVVHVPNRASLPELGDYYKDESTGKIYWNNWQPNGNPQYQGYANNYVEMTLHTSASKPTGTGSTGAHIYFAQDTGKYYDYGDGSAYHYRYHEDEVVSGTLPSTGEVGKIYSDGGKCYRYVNNTWIQISPFFETGEVIERRAMFAQTFAFDGTVWPLPGSYASGIISDSDDTYINKGKSKFINNLSYTKYASALFYDQDLRQNSDDTPLVSRYNTYTDGQNPITHPRTMNIQLFEIDTAPHAWCVKDAVMSDKVENWMFEVGTKTIESVSRTMCYFLLSTDYLIANGNTAVVQASLGLCYKASTEYESYVDVNSAAEDFMPFKLSLYKQLPTKPYVMNGNTAEFDSSHNTTAIFEDKNINVTNSGYTYNGYSVMVKHNMTFDGFRMNASGNVKNGIFNEKCFYLEITTSQTIEPGATFLFKLSPK